MKTVIFAAAVLAIAQPGFAQPGAGSPGPPAGQAAAMVETAAVKAVLAEFHAGIERLDATGTEKLFTADSAVFETGGVEGSYANYLARHLGPELGHCKSFKFSDYRADVRFEGPVALTTETYKYRIETKDGTIVERQGVSTSALKKIDGQWKIFLSHNSGRKPKGS